MSVKVKFTQYEIEKLHGCLGVLSSLEGIRAAVIYAGCKASCLVGASSSKEIKNELSSDNYADRLALELESLWGAKADVVGNIEVDVIASALNKMLEAIDAYDYINPITDAVELKKIKSLKDKLLHAVSDCGELWP